MIYGAENQLPVIHKSDANIIFRALSSVTIHLKVHLYKYLINAETSNQLIL